MGKMSSYTDASSVIGTEEILCVIGGVNKNITPNQILDKVTTAYPTIVNVRNFGAVGDGTTDDSVAIQAAIDYAATIYGTVIFPDKQYLIGLNQILPISSESAIGLIVKSNTTIDLGHTTLIVKANSGDRRNVLQFHRLKM